MTVPKWDLRRIAEFKELSLLCGKHGAWPDAAIRAEMDKLADTVNAIVALWPSEALQACERGCSDPSHHHTITLQTHAK